MKLIKPIAKFTLVTQILFPMLFSATSVASALNTKLEKVSHREVLAKIQSNLPELTSKQTDETQSMKGDELLAQGLNKSAQIISQDNSRDAAKNLAQSTAYGFVSNQMTNWLNQYGNATIQISSDKAFSGEYFLPFYETEDNLFFSQSRIQRQNEDRTTLNLGLGYRYFMTNKMLGINSFYDHDLKNHNARWGLGAEFGADYIKFAANGYFRLTDWRESRLSAFHDYDERPANGFDIKAEGFLPSYPQLGANIKYEKYFGDKVNLKGSNSISDLKKDPQAYTVGLSYTPVPLLSFSLNQSMGDVNETKGELAVNYRFGVPLSQQLDTDLVQQMRTLMGARYNPVDRNNTIVMQYKKHEEPTTVDVNNVNQANIKATSNTGYETPDGLTIMVKEEVTLTVTLKDSNGKPVTGKEIIINCGDDKCKITKDSVNSKGEYIFKTQSNDIGKYTYGFKVNDEPAKSMVDVIYTKSIEVDKENQAKIVASSSNGSVKPNGLIVTVGDKNVTITVTLKDSDGESVTDKTVSILKTKDDDNKITFVETNNEGDYIFNLYSEKSGNYIYGFTVDGKKAKSIANVEYKSGPVFKDKDKSWVSVEGSKDKSVVLLYENETATIKIKLRDQYDNHIELQSVIGTSTGRKLDVSSCQSADDSNYDYRCITPTTEEARYGKTKFKVTGTTGGTGGIESNEIRFVYDKILAQVEEGSYPAIVYFETASKNSRTITAVKTDIASGKDYPVKISSTSEKIKFTIEGNEETLMITKVDEVVQDPACQPLNKWSEVY